MDASILAGTIFGMPVVVDGASERLKDLGVVKDQASWRIVAVRTQRRDATFVRWSLDGATASAAADGNPAEVTWLRETLFDRQVVDLDGRRVCRVGDVVLRQVDDRLEVVAVEVGAAAVLRRLGFGRLAARLEPQLLPIERLHVPSAAAGGLLLDAPRDLLERLDPVEVTDLLARLPVPVAEHAVRQSQHREAVAHHAQIRRLIRRYRRTSR